MVTISFEALQKYIQAKYPECSKSILNDVIDLVCSDFNVIKIGNVIYKIV